FSRDWSSDVCSSDLKLNEIGLEIIEIRSIQDQPKIIIETLEELVDKTDVLITTGGLGPTNDDLTKKSLCEFLKTDLVLDKEILKIGRASCREREKI